MDKDNTIGSSDTDRKSNISNQKAETRTENDFDSNTDESETENSNGNSSPVILSDTQYLSSDRDDIIDRNPLDLQIIRYNSSSLRRQIINEVDDDAIHTQVKQRNDYSMIREASISENRQCKTSAHEMDTEQNGYDTTSTSNSPLPSQTSFLNAEKSKTKSLHGDDSDSAIDILYSIRTLFEEQSQENGGKENSFVSEANCCVCCCCCLCCFPSFCSCKSKVEKTRRNKSTLKASGSMSATNVSTSAYMDNYSLTTGTMNEGQHSKYNETHTTAHEQNYSNTTVRQEKAVEDKTSGMSMNVSSGENFSQKLFLKKEKSKSKTLKEENASETDLLQNNSFVNEPQDKVQDNKGTNTKNTVIPEATIADQKSCVCCFCFFPSLCSCKSPARETEQGTIAHSTGDSLEYYTLVVAGTSVISDEYKHKAVSVNEDKDKGNGIKPPVKEKNPGAAFLKDNKADNNKDVDIKSLTGKATTDEESNHKSSAMDKECIRSDNQTEEKIHQGSAEEYSKDAEKLHKEQYTANEAKIKKDNDETVDLQDMNDGTSKDTSCFCFFRTRTVKSVPMKSHQNIFGNADNSTNVVQSINNEKDTNKSTSQVKKQHDQNNIRKIPVAKSTKALASQSASDNDRVPSKIYVNEKEKLKKDRAKGMSIDNNDAIDTAKSSSGIIDRSTFNKNVSSIKRQNTSSVSVDSQNSGDVEHTACFCFLGARPSLNSAPVDSHRSILETDVSQNLDKKPDISTSVVDEKTSKKVMVVDTEQVNDNCTSKTMWNAQNVSKIKSGRKGQRENMQHIFVENENQTRTNSEQCELDANKMGKRNSEMPAIDEQKGKEDYTHAHSFGDNSPLNKARKENTSQQKLADMDRKSSNSVETVGREKDGVSKVGKTTRGGKNASNITFADEEMTNIDHAKEANTVNEIDKQKGLKDDKRASKDLVSNRNTTVKTSNTEAQCTSTAKGFSSISGSSLLSTSDKDQQNENKTLDGSQRKPTNVLIKSNNNSKSMKASTDVNRSDKDVDKDGRNKSLKENVNERKIVSLNDIGCLQNSNAASFMGGEQTKRDDYIDKHSQRENTKHSSSSSYKNNTANDSITQSVSNFKENIESPYLGEVDQANAIKTQQKDINVRDDDQKLLCAGQSPNQTLLVEKKQVAKNLESLSEAPNTNTSSINLSHLNTSEKDDDQESAEKDRTNITTNENKANSSLKTLSMHMEQSSLNNNTYQSENDKILHSSDMNGEDDLTNFVDGNLETKSVDIIKPADENKTITLPLGQTSHQGQVSMLDEDDTTVTIANAEGLNVDEKKLDSFTPLESKTLNTNRGSFIITPEPVNIYSFKGSTKQKQIETTRTNKVDENADASSQTQTSKHNLIALSDMAQSNVNDTEQHSTAKQPKAVDVSSGSFANDELTQLGETNESHLSQQIEQKSIPSKSYSVKQDTITDGKEHSKLTEDNEISNSYENASYKVESFPNLTTVMPAVGLSDANNVMTVPMVTFPAKLQNLTNDQLGASTKNVFTSNASNISGHNSGAAKTRTTTSGLTAVDNSISDTINNKAKTTQSRKNSRTVPVNKVNMIPSKPLGQSSDRIGNNKVSTSKIKTPGTVDTKIVTLSDLKFDTNKETNRPSVQTKEAAKSVLNKNKLSDKTKSVQEASNNQTHFPFQAVGGDFTESSKATVVKTKIQGTKKGTKSEVLVSGDDNQQLSKEKVMAPMGAKQNLNKVKAEKSATTASKEGPMTKPKPELVKPEQVNETLLKPSYNSTNETRICSFNKGHAAAKTESTKELENYKNNAEIPSIQGASHDDKETHDIAERNLSLLKKNDTTKISSTLRKTKFETTNSDNYAEADRSAYLVESSRNGTNSAPVSNARNINKGTSVNKASVFTTKTNVRDLKEGRNGQDIKASQESMKTSDTSLPRKQTVGSPEKNKLVDQNDINKDIAVNMLVANGLVQPGITVYIKGKEMEGKDHLNSSYITKDIPVKDSKLQNQSNFAKNTMRTNTLSKKVVEPNTKIIEINKTKIDVPVVKEAPESIVRPQIGVQKIATGSKASNTSIDKTLDAKKANNRPTSKATYTNVINNTLATKQVTDKKKEQKTADQEKNKGVLLKEHLNTDTQKAKPSNLSVAKKSTAAKASSKGNTMDKVNATKMPENNQTQINDSVALGPVTETPNNNLKQKNVNNKEQNSSKLRVPIHQKSVKTTDPGVSGRMPTSTKGKSDSNEHIKIAAKRTVISKQAQPENGDFINEKISKGKVHLESSADDRKPMGNLQHQTHALTNINYRGNSNKKISVTGIHNFSNSTHSPSNTDRGIVTVKPYIPMKTQTGKFRLPGGKDKNVIELQMPNTSGQVNNTSTNYGDKNTGNRYNKTTINTFAKGEIVKQKLPIEEKNKPTLSKTRPDTNIQTEKASMTSANIKTNKVSTTTAIKKDKNLNTSSSNRGPETKTNKINVTPAHNANKTQVIEKPKHASTALKVSEQHHEPEKIIPTKMHSAEVVNRTAPTRQSISKQKLQTQRGNDADPKVMGNKNSAALSSVRETGEFIDNKLSMGKKHDLDSNIKVQINTGITFPHKINAVVEKNAGVGTMDPTQIKNHVQNVNDNRPAVKNSTPVRAQDVRKTATVGTGKKITTSHNTSNVNERASVDYKMNAIKTRSGDTHGNDNKTVIHKPTTVKPAKQNLLDDEKQKLPLPKVNPHTNKVTVALANNTEKPDNGMVSKMLSKSRDTSGNKGTENNPIRNNVRQTQQDKLSTDTKSFDNKPNGSLQKESKSIKEHVGHYKKAPVSNDKAVLGNQRINIPEAMQSNRNIIGNSSNQKDANKDKTTARDMIKESNSRKTDLPTMKNLSPASRECNIFSEDIIQNKNTVIQVVNNQRLRNKTSIANISKAVSNPKTFNAQPVNGTQNANMGRSKPFNSLPLQTEGNMKQKGAEQKQLAPHYSYNEVNTAVSRRPVRQSHSKVPI